MPRIITPEDWSIEKDIAYFEADYNPDPSYTAALWDMVEFHYQGYTHTLNATILYFRRHDCTRSHIPTTCLSITEKIQLLREIAHASPVPAKYRLRLLEAVTAYLIAERERRRIFREYRSAGEDAFLFPVLQAKSYLGHAEFLLDEAMRCENDDYAQLNQEAPADE